MMSGVGVSLDYGREKAPQDVLDSLDWLAHEGFVLVGERGGPGESFGNLLMEFERSPLAVGASRGIGANGQPSLLLAAVSSSRSTFF